MQPVYLLSDDDLDDVQVGYEGCAESEFESFHEQLVKEEEDAGSDDDKETAENVLDVEKILDSLLPSDLLDSVREFSDSEARRRSDDSLVHQLVWLLDNRRRYRAASNDCQALRGELEIELGHVHELKVELSGLKSEKASWSKLSGEVVELRATNQSHLDTIAEMKLVVDGCKSDSLNRGLQIEAQKNRICELEGRVAGYAALESQVVEQGRLVTAKDGQIFVLEQKNKTLDDSLAGALEQVTKEREAKEAALSELAKLRGGLEQICDKVLKDPTITDPFNAYAQGLMEYGSHRTVVRAQKAFEESPPVFPEELLQMVKPDSKVQAKQLFEAAKNAKSAYVAKLVGNPDLSVDELLAIDP